MLVCGWPLDQIHVTRMRQLPTNPILAALSADARYMDNRRISKGLTVAASPGTRPVDAQLNHAPNSLLDTSPVISTNYNILPNFRGKPGVGAGVSRHQCTPLQ